LKFSVFPKPMPPISLEEICSEAAKRGFDGVELYDNSPPQAPQLSLLKYGFDKAAAKKLKEMIASKGLVLTDIAHGSVGTTENDLVLLRVAMELAVTLNVKLIRTFIGTSTPPPGTSESQYLEQISGGITNLRKAAKMAEDYGVFLGVDNHYFLTVLDNVNIVRQIGSPNLKIFIDAGNCAAHGEDLIKSVRAASELLVHGHIKEPMVYGRGVKPPLPGYEGVALGREADAELGSTGLIDWEAYVKTLKEIGFKGFLSVEFSSIYMPNQHDWDKAERTMNYVKKICKKVGI